MKLQVQTIGAEVVIVLPSELVQRLGLAEGATIEATVDDGGFTLRAPARPATDSSTTDA